MNTSPELVNDHYVEIDTDDWSDGKRDLRRAFNFRCNMFFEDTGQLLDMEIDGPRICYSVSHELYPFITESDRKSICAEVMEEARAALDFYWQETDE